RLLHGAWRRADGEGFASRRASSEAAGRLRGIGISYYVEVCAGFGEDQPLLAFRDDGMLELRVGTQSTGQGHETVFTQMLVSRLGVRPEQVQVRQGDTALLAMGAGTGGSRSLAVGGSAVALTVDAMVAAGKRMAASLVEADASDIDFVDGQFKVVGTDIVVPLAEVVAASFDERRRVEGVLAGLESSETYSPAGGTFPNGCHVCEVEVDPETGEIAIVAYVIQDDMGRIGNALLLEGQIVGGAVQGLSQALIEEVVYEADSAQLLTGSFMDYGVLRANQAPTMDVRFDCVPSPNNHLGVKGAGEAGTIGAPAAVVNAVLDALRPAGVTSLDMPLTPHRVWQALRQA
ncbi:MAG: molybdopterin cofactor-binding domain-containing protein, partial [Pseudomonadota bacterium]